MYASYNTRKEVIIAEGISHKVLTYGRTMMSVETLFEDRIEGDYHKHVHEQSSYILEGKFEWIVEGEKFICTPGDMVYIPSNLLHQVFCVNKGKMIDVYSPIREDFLV